MEYLYLIQCRLGGERLPNKCFLNFNGKSLIEWIYIRIKDLNKNGKLLIAIPDNSSNDILEDYLLQKKIPFFRGSEKDLVDRFYRAALKYNAKNIIRICADNPFVCKKEIARLVRFHKKYKYDYCYNHIPINNRYPDGLGAEICNFQLLKTIHLNAKPSQREHVFNYVWHNKKKFQIGTFDPPNDLSFPKLKLDIDTLNDYWKLTKTEFKINSTTKNIVNFFKK